MVIRGGLVMSYKVIFHTSSFVDFDANTPDALLVNEMMHKLDGKSFTESSLRELKWRINTLIDVNWFPSGVAMTIGWEFESWYNKSSRINYMTTSDGRSVRYCMPTYPSKCNGTWDFEPIATLLALSDCNTTVDFCMFYDTWNFAKNYRGCYLEIFKC